MANNFGTSNIVNGGGNEFIIEMDQMLDELEPCPSFEPSIFRVPMEIRKVNEEAYTPSIVSIGPFHHNNKKLKSMEQFKKRYMKKLIRRNGNSCLMNCTDFVTEKEADIRVRYSESIEMDSKEFRKMVLVDSCFIIQFLIYVYTDWEGIDFSLYINNMTMHRLNLDLMLLENQVPFFVLHELCRLAISEEFSILDLALNFLKKATNTHLFAGFENTNSSKLDIESIKHFTDMVLILHQLPLSQGQGTTQHRIFQTLYSSTELTEAGVTFKGKTGSKGLFDISFNKGVLEIPSFWLTDHVEIQIRNLMALELLLYEDNCFLTDYFVLMDCLVNTVVDVNLLVRKKIIINHLSDDKKATYFINNLCINIPQSNNFYFSDVCKELNDYYEVPSHKLKAVLKRDYFRNPCLAASTVAAITLLVLTVIQTLCTVMSTVSGKQNFYPHG